MKLKYFICCTLLSGAFSLASCDKDEVIVNPTAETIIKMINEKKPYVAIQQDGSFSNGTYFEYSIDGYWLITCKEELHDSKYTPVYTYWNLNYVTHFEWTEETGTLGLYIVQP